MDKLEKEYYDLRKIFKGDAFKIYGTPDSLKELGDLLMYRRMKKNLEGIDEEELIKELIEDIKDLLGELYSL